MPLTPRQEHFVRLIVGGETATWAYSEAFGCSKDAAVSGGSRLLTNAKVAAEVARRNARVTARVEAKAVVTKEQVIAKLAKIAFADPRELTEMRCVPCSHCWCDLTAEEKKAKGAPQDDCDLCSGSGTMHAMIKDTRHLSPEAQALYAGVKMTASGPVLNTHDQVKALELLGKTFGIFIEKTEAIPAGEKPVHSMTKEERRARIAELRAAEREKP